MIQQIWGFRARLPFQEEKINKITDKKFKHENRRLHDQDWDTNEKW